MATEQKPTTLQKISNMYRFSLYSITGPFIWVHPQFVMWFTMSLGWLKVRIPEDRDPEHPMLAQAEHFMLVLALLVSTLFLADDPLKHATKKLYTKMGVLNNEVFEQLDMSHLNKTTYDKQTYLNYLKRQARPSLSNLGLAMIFCFFFWRMTVNNNLPPNMTPEQNMWEAVFPAGSLTILLKTFVNDPIITYLNRKFDQPAYARQINDTIGKTGYYARTVLGYTMIRSGYHIGLLATFCAIGVQIMKMKPWHENPIYNQGLKYLPIGLLTILFMGATLPLLMTTLGAVNNMSWFKEAMPQTDAQLLPSTTTVNGSGGLAAVSDAPGADSNMMRNDRILRKQ